MLERVLFRTVLVAFFILANAFFVAAEFALVSIRSTRVEQLLALGRPGALTALTLKRNLDEFLPAVQFGVTLAALALGWLGEPVITELILRALHAVGVNAAAHRPVQVLSIILAFGLITYFEVLLGELVPKALALQRADQIALAVAGPMDVFIRMTRPAVRLMNSSATFVLRLFRVPLRGEGGAHSPEELKMIATSTRRMGLLLPEQEEIIHRAIELNEVAVREIMTPRGKIVSLPADLPVEQASARVVEDQHSRVPVYDPEGGPENIIGIVYSKDISRLMHFLRPATGPRQAQPAVTLRQIMREPLVVPETKLALELLDDFQRRRRHMAIVVDEFGSTAGLVTAEDILEQVVGELNDEFDVAPHQVQLLSAAGAMILDGASPLRDLSNQLHWRFPREAGIETLAGFLLAQLGHIPEPGEAVESDGRRYVVEAMSNRRITRVRVEQTAEGAELAGAGKGTGPS